LGLNRAANEINPKHGQQKIERIKVEESIRQKLPDPSVLDSFRRESSQEKGKRALISCKRKQQKQNDKNCRVEQDNVSHCSVEARKPHCC
jgi:hypothetical protein